MRRVLLILFCLCALSVGSLSANNPNTRKGEKTQFCLLDEELSYLKSQNILSPEKFAEFEKLYREYNSQRNAYKKENRELSRQSRDENLSEEEVLRIVNNINNNKMAMAVLKQSFHYKYLEIMTAKQYVRLNSARNEFKQEVFNKWRKEKSDK